MKRTPPPFRFVYRFLMLGTLGGVFLNARLAAAAVSPGDAGEIRAVLAAQVAAWNRGDIDGFMNGYARSDSTEFVSGDKLTRGWKTVRDRDRPLEAGAERRYPTGPFHSDLPPHGARLAHRA